MGKATLDTRPLFEFIRHEAYVLHVDFDNYDAFEASLVEFALESAKNPMLSRATSGEPIDLTDADRRKAELCAHKVARWVWDRFRNPDGSLPATY